MKPERFQHRLDTVISVAKEAREVGGEEAANALADCERTLRRIIARAAVAEPFERVEVAQMHGPALEFTGRLLCNAQFSDRRAGRTVTLELYETEGGALVAVTAFELGEGGQESEKATVVTPIADVQAMRFAVMEGFNWHTEAKKMVRKKLGWDLRREIA